MNCRECRQLVQQLLDGDCSVEECSALDAHLKACHGCRELFGAAKRLIEGLRLQVMPTPPAGLAQRVGQSVLFQSRRMRAQRLVWRGALAASILAVLSAGYFWSRGTARQDESGTLVRSVQPEIANRSPSLNQSVEEASQAVFAITRRAADETVGQGRMLMPRVLPETPGAGIPELEPLLEQPSRSLREIQDGMTAGLEPVTTSARRAMDLFLRELPGPDRSNKRGS